MDRGYTVESDTYVRKIEGGCVTYELPNTNIQWEGDSPYSAAINRTEEPGVQDEPEVCYATGAKKEERAAFQEKIGTTRTDVERGYSPASAARILAPLGRKAQETLHAIRCTNNGGSYANNARVFAARLSERIARVHRSKPRVLSDAERVRRRTDLEDAGFYDDHQPGQSGLLLRPEDGEAAYSSQDNRRPATGEERAVNFKKWFGKSLSEIDGVPMVFWQSSETFGAGGAETFTFDDSFLGSNVPHPRTNCSAPLASQTQRRIRARADPRRRLPVTETSFKASKRLENTEL